MAKLLAIRRSRIAQLTEGSHPVVRLQTSAHFREYIKNRVQIEFDGFDETDGHIGEAKDEATGLIDHCATAGNILTIRGYGLKIESDEANKESVGVFFQSAITGVRIKATVIAVNEHRTLKVVVPAGLNPSHSYTLLIVTQSSSKGGGHTLKELREMRSDFYLTPAP